jgi:hypothetical protein
MNKLFKASVHKINQTVFHPRLAVVLHDLIMVAIAWYVAKAFRLSFEPASQMQALRWSELLLVVVDRPLSRPLAIC